MSPIHTIIKIIKIGEKGRKNAIEQSPVRASVLMPLIRIPIDAIAKLKIIKGNTKRKNPKGQPDPSSSKPSLKLIVMLSAINVEIIEITPSTFEAAFLTPRAEIFFLFSFTSTGSRHSLIT